MKLPLKRLMKICRTVLTTFTADGGADFEDSTDKRLMDLLSALHHFSDTYQFDWEDILNKSKIIYKNDLINIRDETKP